MGDGDSIMGSGTLRDTVKEYRAFPCSWACGSKPPSAIPIKAPAFGLAAQSVLHAVRWKEAADLLQGVGHAVIALPMVIDALNCQGFAFQIYRTMDIERDALCPAFAPH